MSNKITYTKLQQADNTQSGSSQSHFTGPPFSSTDSFELDSLASSTPDEDDASESQRTPPSRELSPLGSPIINDYDEDRNGMMDLDDDDYERLLLGGGGGGAGNNSRHIRANSASTLGDLVFTLPETRDRRAEIEIPLEKQKRLSLFDGLSLVIGLQIG